MGKQGKQGIFTVCFGGYMKNPIYTSKKSPQKPWLRKGWLFSHGTGRMGWVYCRKGLMDLWTLSSKYLVSGWWFQTWLDYDFRFLKRDVIRNPTDELTNSIIFQDGHKTHHQPGQSWALLSRNAFPQDRFICWEELQDMAISVGKYLYTRPGKQTVRELENGHRNSG